MAGERGKSERELSEDMLDKIERNLLVNGGKVGEATLVVPLYGRVVDRGNIGTFMCDLTGTFQITVKRVSTATTLIVPKPDA